MSEDKKNAMMSIVMLGDMNLPNNAALSNAIQIRLPDAQLSPDLTADENGALLFFARGAVCGIMRLEAACPISSQDPSFVAAWYWPDAWEMLRGHRAHVIVSVSGDADERTRAVLLGQLVAAVVESTPTPLGVHCAGSDALWPARAALAMVASGSDALPLPLCVSVKLGRDAAEGPGRQPAKISAITKGLATFGSMEIETHDHSGDPQTLSDFLLDLASYFIESGSVINDGDTIGPDEKNEIVVRQEASRLVPGQKVYRLYFQ